MKDAVISVKQHFFTRYAALLFMLIVGVLFFVTWQIRYPQLVPVAAVVQPINESGNRYVDLSIDEKVYHQIRNRETIQYSIRSQDLAQPVYREASYQFIANNGLGKQYNIRLKLSHDRALQAVAGSTINILLKLDNPRLFWRIVGGITI
jgi:hypothetical protein